jgi:hypothetical protein
MPTILLPMQRVLSLIDPHKNKQGGQLLAAALPA